jgi:hypothetical protein
LSLYEHLPQVIQLAETMFSNISPPIAVLFISSFDSTQHRACSLSQTLPVSRNIVTSLLYCYLTRCILVEICIAKYFVNSGQQFQCKVIFENEHTFWSWIHHAQFLRNWRE